MRVPVLNGIFTDTGPDFRTSYPVNLIPVPKEQGISKGYLRPADGIVQNGTGAGITRGGINWNGTCYRVMGSKLVTVAENGTVSELGDVGSDLLPVSFDYSFDRLAIASNGNLFYWNGSTLTEVTDPDLGTVVDMLWVDGYFMTTDGEFLIVTELGDPTSVNPLKYGSSEIDPDPVEALIKLRNEVYALNRHTIEVFDNVGGEFFPFQRVDGAQIQKGTVGTHCCCIFNEAIAFLGGGKNEPVGIHVGGNGNAAKISTREIDTILAEFTESELSLAVMEARTDHGHSFLLLHLPDRTVVYDAAASSALGEPVWHILTTDLDGFSEYRARYLVRAYDKWLVGDTQSANVGYLSDTVSTHWAESVRWEFGTTIIYNNGLGAILHQIELVSLTGRTALGADPRIWSSYSTDGLSWSQDKAINAGKQGQTGKRLVWFQQGFMRERRIQRFRGTSDSRLAMAALEIIIEGLAI